MPKSAKPSVPTSPACDDGWAIYNIEATVQNAIDRMGEAMLEVDGIEVTTLEPMHKWGLYRDELCNMAAEWADRYPLAAELAKLRPSTLANLWHDVAG